MVKLQNERKVVMNELTAVIFDVANNLPQKPKKFDNFLLPYLKSEPPNSNLPYNDISPQKKAVSFTLSIH